MLFFKPSSLVALASVLKAAVGLFSTMPATETVGDYVSVDERLFSDTDYAKHEDFLKHSCSGFKRLKDVVSP